MYPVQFLECQNSFIERVYNINDLIVVYIIGFFHLKRKTQILVEIIDSNIRNNTYN